MLYIKVMDGSGAIIGAEAHESPVYVNRLRNGTINECSEHYAQGVVSLDGSQTYQLDGRESLGIDNALTAAPIYGTEYEQIIQELEPTDPEDDHPIVPDPGEGEEAEPLTRAELTARLLELEASASSMIVQENVVKGGCFILHDTIYQALVALPKGTEIKAGKNCIVKNLNDLI